MPLAKTGKARTARVECGFWNKNARRASTRLSPPSMHEGCGLSENPRVAERQQFPGPITEDAQPRGQTLPQGRKHPETREQNPFKMATTGFFVAVLRCRKQGSKGRIWQRPFDTPLQTSPHHSAQALDQPIFQANISIWKLGGQPNKVPCHRFQSSVCMMCFSPGTRPGLPPLLATTYKRFQYQPGPRQVPGRGCTFGMR